MKYIANPVEADGFEIIAIDEPGGVLYFRERIPLKENDEIRMCDAFQPNAEMLARMKPAVGDYLVIQSDGYMYLNPKAVFERKYRTAPVEQILPWQFRKRPIVIQAIQLTWANWGEICDFVPKPWFVKGVWLDNNGAVLPDGQTRDTPKGDDSSLGLIMQTLESEKFLAVGGDWIIKGVKGEFYPCKPDIFAATYEAVE